MKKKPDPSTSHAASKHPNPAVKVKNIKEKIEPLEVAGRHKNDGQMPHKGAR